MNETEKSMTVTYAVKLTQDTYDHKDLAFTQALRQLIKTFQPYLDEGQIDSLLRAESNRPRPSKASE
ncbi:hypothetical protein [Pseudarthrobacter sp. ATCC 49987]|uniref:hypothetical protein n=1 Tax=Pseudarthrobacter sp. ATCC 49987 TaxID=2698204 RepID=UPI00136C0565|nr:hypothetical protein [Pseudarthrobacter sp. ATCC 49987]